jgi:hypothetical protein
MSDTSLEAHNPGWGVLSAKGPADIGWHALGPAIALTAMAFATVVLRWYSRAIITRRVGLEDTLITLALLLSVAITGIVGAEFGLDYSHVDNEDDEVSKIATMMKVCTLHCLDARGPSNICSWSTRNPSFFIPASTWLNPRSSFNTFVYSPHTTPSVTPVPAYSFSCLRVLAGASLEWCSCAIRLRSTGI